MDPGFERASIERSGPSREAKIAELRRRVDSLDAEKLVLEKELQRLQRLELPEMEFVAPEPVGPMSLRPHEKIALFLNLFAARRSVFPKLWENVTTGKRGYSPACDNEWRPGICRKPQIKCAECPHQRFPALDERTAEAHLRGLHTIGTYAIREDDSCIFLAADFDGEGWKEDIAAYCNAARKTGVEVSIERSRSGNGAHAWIFFLEPVPAILARRLGTILLAKASAAHPTMGLGAYDRLFPNQDTLPAGGFGNLIALPLANGPRKDGNTVFLDSQLEPHADQWSYLAGVRRLSRPALDEVLGRMAPLNPLPANERSTNSNFSLQSDEITLDLSRPVVAPGSIVGDLTIRLDSRLHIPRSIPIAPLAALKRLATFANPVFHEKLRLRFPTYDTPRFIIAGEWHPDRLLLPRGTMDAALGILESAGASITLQDARTEGTRVRWRFGGQLRPGQQAAVEEMTKHDFGVLCAPPGAGKTVMGCALIARHRTSTLVLVHRSLLLEQWRQEAERFLGLKRKEIGFWRGRSSRLTRRLDIAMLPSLARKEDFSSVFEGYGLVIVDECHHVPAVSFEALLKACATRKIVGLTATPKRKDGLEKLLHLQCGPIRHTVIGPNDEIIPKTVYVRRSSFHIPGDQGSRPTIHAIWQALVEDADRMKQIVADVRSCLEEGRCPLVLSDRKSHLAALEEALKAEIGLPDIAIYRLESGIGKKLRVKMREEIDHRFETGGKFVLLSTASLVGEGYDLPRLDTLILAMPLSFKGRLVQYAGRLHRPHDDKREIRIYDYVDDNPVTTAMFRRRSGAYREMGYRMEMGCEATEWRLDLK